VLGSVRREGGDGCGSQRGSTERRRYDVLIYERVSRERGLEIESWTYLWWIKTRHIVPIKSNDCY
jgi:hypothetical protein